MFGFLANFLSPASHKMFASLEDMTSDDAPFCLHVFDAITKDLDVNTLPENAPEDVLFTFVSVSETLEVVNKVFDMEFPK